MTWYAKGKKLPHGAVPLQFGGGLEWKDGDKKSKKEKKLPKRKAIRPSQGVLFFERLRDIR